MPNQNSDQSNQPGNPVSVISPQADLPPMPPAFQAVTVPAPVSGAPAETGGGAANLPPMISSTTPKKKYGGGRVIATILGILLLVGGVGAGYFLTQQPQLFKQQAYEIVCEPGTTDTCTVNGCAGTKTCNSMGTGYGPCVKNNPSCGLATPPPPTPGLPPCGTGLDCKTTAVTGASTCQNSYGDKLWCCGSGQTINANNTCQNVATCPTGRSCGNKSVPGATQCRSTNGQLAFCCPAGQTYDEFNGCFTPTTNSCTSDSQCTFPQFCDRGTNKCVYAPNVSCGRDQDPTAPVCCSATVKSACGTSALPGSVKVCEPSRRLECKIGTPPNEVFCLIQANSSQCGGGGTPPPPTSTPTLPPIIAGCSKVTAYSSTWAALTAAQLSALKAGTTINFCVVGTATYGSFDKAKFTINGAIKPETTTKGSGPAANAFCQSYQIPSAVYSFNVSAQVHHINLGWSN